MRKKAVHKGENNCKDEKEGMKRNLLTAISSYLMSCDSEFTMQKY